MLNGGKFTHKIAEDSQPLRDTFAVLFFVSVGTLFDPAVLLRQPLEITAGVAIVIVGNGLAAFAITTMFKLPGSTGLMMAVTLAQIGEFSSVLAGLGQRSGMMSDATSHLFLAATLISIAINALLFSLAERLGGPPSTTATTPSSDTAHRPPRAA